jgi:hypothetical protein
MSGWRSRYLDRAISRRSLFAVVSARVACRRYVPSWSPNSCDRHPQSSCKLALLCCAGHFFTIHNQPIRSCGVLLFPCAGVSGGRSGIVAASKLVASHSFGVNNSESGHSFGSVRWPAHGSVWPTSGHSNYRIGRSDLLVPPGGKESFRGHGTLIGAIIQTAGMAGAA